MGIDAFLEISLAALLIGSHTGEIIRTYINVPIATKKIVTKIFPVGAISIEISSENFVPARITPAKNATVAAEKPKLNDKNDKPNGKSNAERIRNSYLSNPERN